MADLLIQWEDLYKQGQDTPAGVLCKDHPELTETLARQIAALKRVAWLDKKLEDESDDPGDGKEDHPRPPKLLAGRYRLDELIATGGFAEVWRAFDQELQRIIAVKIPKRTVVGSSESFLAEARRVARLKHPAILPVYDVGLDGNDCFFVSEYVEGGSLADRLAHGRLSVDQARQWISAIADALDHAHRSGVIHRDVKPANILIDAHNRALLADFGIAQSSMKTGSLAPSLGTLRYMSPEQLDGQAAVPQSDIYSLAVVLHECLTGKPPYSSAEPNTLRREIGSGAEVSRDVPKSLGPVLRKALNKDPGQRHATAAEFATAVSAPRETGVATAVEALTGRPWKKLLIGAILAASVIAFMMSRAHKSSSPLTPQQELVADDSGVPPHDRRIWNAVTDHPGKKFFYDPQRRLWIETTDEGKSFANFYPVAITDDYIQILDRSRNLGIRLYADRCDYSCTSDFVNDCATLCTGRWFRRTSFSSSSVVQSVRSEGDMVTNSIGMQLRMIPEGTFVMGSEDNDPNERPAHEVRITKPFYLGVHEVTNAAWKRVMGAVPSEWPEDDKPVASISWYQAVEFCQKLSELPEEKAVGRSYRLPTEAEWEYACRADSTTLFPFGSDAANLGEYAWLTMNSDLCTHPVGKKKPNPWGLHDIQGNVWEWCSDRYGTYGGGPADGTDRVTRGNGWGCSPDAGCASSRRGMNEPSAQLPYLGFRVAMDGPSSPYPPEFDKPITIHSARDTLENYLVRLSRHTGIAISINTKELERQGITKNQSFGLDVTDKPARNILTRVLSEADQQGRLTAVLRGSDDGQTAIEITTKQALERQQ